MFLWISEQLGHPGILNLFRYITFRSALAALTALILVANLALHRPLLDAGHAGAADRHPAIAIVDELAHTNVPGSKNSKRYQDVLELLDSDYTFLNDKLAAAGSLDPHAAREAFEAVWLRAIPHADYRPV